MTITVIIIMTVIIIADRFWILTLRQRHWVTSRLLTLLIIIFMTIMITTIIIMMTIITNADRVWIF